MFALSGVLVEAQLNHVMRELGRQQGVQTFTFPASEVKNGAAAVFTLPKNLSGKRLEITPVIGADGYTLDLTVTRPRLDTTQAKGGSLAVSLWSEQTLILSGYLAEEKDRAQVIFITVSLRE